ncbi:hypothetical protein LTS17_006583 [Exophiala oligosperma]
MQEATTRSLEGALATLPPPVAQTSLREDISRRRAQSSLPVLVVLDDDPTGTQTCHDINVLTAWEVELLVAEFRATPSGSGFFILTNSRALHTSEARDLIRTICVAVQQAAKIASVDFELVLRGDSTLRGHFPDEPEVAESVIGEVDGWILAPFFRQGGRLTIGDVHYVADVDGSLVPVAQTPFAKDATFGFRSSNLKDYVAEKSKGAITAEQVESISLKDVREGGASGVAARLLGFQRKCVVIVNAVVDTDMEIFVQGLLQARDQGKRYIYRTGAAFVSTRLGLSQIPPLTAEALNMDLEMSSPGGLIIAGSYVPKTTAQLESLIAGRGKHLHTVVIQVDALLETHTDSEDIILRAADEAGQKIAEGIDVLVMTSRKLITGHDERSSLAIGSVIAKALVLFLRLLNPRPRYIIAKGGITSSDMATKGLRMKRARILGQAASGVPLWQCHETVSKFPAIPYVVFPGNVGDKDTLRELVAGWAKSKPNQNIPPMRYRRLGKSGLKTSQIILGCMTLGNPQWEGSPWVLPEKEALPILKKAYDLGINTWDTANTYSNGLSEDIIGKALTKYSIPRSKVVIMTKLYYPVMEQNPNSRPNPAVNDGALVNQMGLSRKHIFDAVEASLRRLDTTYIDVLQIHRLDTETSPEEIMRALHDLVQQGKVHYLGASSMPCWQLARLQYAAKMHDWTPFSSMQNLWNLLYREEERDVVPFCEAEGIGLIPWSPLARGLLTRPWSEKTVRSEKDAKTSQWFQGIQNEQIVQRVQELAKRKSCTMADVSLAWLLAKEACPVVGLNSLERVKSSLNALRVTLTSEDLEYLQDLYEPLRVQGF